MADKFNRLITILKEMQSAVVAFSGGVDSTFLLMAVKEAGIKSIAVTADSETMPRRDLQSAREMARLIGIEQMIIKTSELSNPSFVRNPKNRCFYCKDELFLALLKIANSEGCRFVIDGSNADDLSDWRPGREAALKHGVRSPLIEAGLSKAEIREISKAKGLPTWSKPASPCLSSRFPYGVEITEEALMRVEGAEEFLRDSGFSEFRVRNHNDLARIELKSEEIERLFDKELREKIVDHLKKFGFKYVTIDLEGFRSGRLNG